jgi:hypothetical protein
VAEARLIDNGDRFANASLRLRVPASRHDDVLTSLRDLDGVAVQSEESNAREVTAEFTDLESRLANLQRTEAQYHALLSQAGNIDEVLKVTTRLDAIRADVEQLQGRIKLLDDQSEFATVSVKLGIAPPAVETGSKGPASPVQVFVDAMESSLVVANAVANAAIVILVASLWLLPLTAISLVVWRRLRGPVQALGRWLG